MRSTRKTLLLSLLLLLISTIAAPSFSFAIKGKVAVIYDKKNNSFSFTADEMKRTLEKGGYEVIVSDIGNLAKVKAVYRIILTVRGTSEADQFLSKASISLPSSVSQGYSVRKQSYLGYKDWYIIGFDDKGVIYGGLDAGES